MAAEKLTKKRLIQIIFILEDNFYLSICLHRRLATYNLEK